MADRYAYIPNIGLYIIVAWGIPGILARLRHKELLLSIMTAAYFSILMTTAWLQTGYWADSVTLFQHAVEVVSSNNYRGHYHLGLGLDRQGRKKEAALHYSEVIRIKPDHIGARNNLGLIMAARGRDDEAINQYSIILSFSPNHAETRNNLAVVLAEQGRIAEAVGHLSEALRIMPDDPKLYNNMGIALFKGGKIREAVTYFQKALEKKSDYAEAKRNLSMALAVLEKMK